MDIKEMLQEGYIKCQKVLVEQYDRNGKVHFILVDDMETAKYYFGSAIKRQVTYLTK